MENAAQYDDDGNEYAVQDAGKSYSKTDLRRIRTSARKILRKDAPARQAWIKERRQAAAPAVQTIGFLAEPESADYAMFSQVKTSPLYKPLVDHLPNSNYAIGLMVKGLRQVQKEQAAAQSQVGTPVNRPKAPTANVEAAGTPKGPKGEVKGKKALTAAKAKFDASGAMADYQTYLRLKQVAA